MRGDGDGWVQFADSQRRWGRHGAAGLLLRAPGGDPTDPLVLLQLRVGWSHHGGTWGIPGGARDSHESAVAAALREAAEETAIDPLSVRVRGHSVVEIAGGSVAGVPTGWAYTTVVGDVAAPLGTVINHESDALEWVVQSRIGQLNLHPGLRASWPGLRAEAATLVLDVANVVGSVPDGWWRDRAGATARLLAGLAATLPRTVQLAGTRPGYRWVSDALAVVEGRATATPDQPGLGILRARGSGDDELVAAVAAAEPGSTVVVSADRGLLARLPPGTPVLGPAAVRGWVD